MRRVPGGRWVSVALGIFLLVLLASLSLPDFRNRPRALPRKKSCISNMKTIEGAVELYLMEHAVGQGTSIDLPLLVHQGYLKTMPVCPGGGQYSIRIQAPARGESGQTVISCTVHGTIDDTTSGL